MLLNCGAGEDSWESLGLQGDPTNQVLKEISPEYYLEGLMLELHYFSHQMQRTDSLEKTLMLGKTEGRRRGWEDELVGWHHQLNGKDPDAGKDWRQEEKGMRGWDSWMASPTQWKWVWTSSGSWWWIGKPGVLQSMGSQSWAQLSDWTPNAGDPGSIPGQGARFHMPQLNSVHAATATAKTWCSQINKTPWTGAP